MTKAQVQTVIDNFRKVLPLTVQENHLAMHQGAVNTDGYKCGTIHCHGGWYAIAACDTLKPIIFVHGANKLAYHLGFIDNMQLRLWAKENPQIWGNSNGAYMFVDKVAFMSESRPGGAQNLQHIIDHWVEVQSRLTE
jgi:hypothetical protein